MNEIGQFYDQHWTIENAYKDPKTRFFQLKLFQEMFPGFEGKVPDQVKKNMVVVDLGCGPGLAAYTYFGHVLRRVRYYAVDVSMVALQQCREMMRDIDNEKAEFMNVDYLAQGLPFGDEFADVIFCPGVLHYALDMRKAVERITAKLKKGGRLVTWIYRKPPPIRGLTDLYLSAQLRSIASEDARIKALMGLTELGIALGKTQASFTLDNDVPLLDMKAGTYSVHDFFYYYVMKLFYNPTVSLHRHYVNNLNAFGHELVHHLPESEILAILQEAGYDLELWNPRGNGVAVIAVRTGLSEEEAARSCE